MPEPRKGPSKFKPAMAGPSGPTPSTAAVRKLASPSMDPPATKRPSADSVGRPHPKRFKPAIDVSEMDSPFKSSKPPAPSRPPLPRKSSPQKSSPDCSDLSSKSLADLTSLLASDKSLRDTIGQMISDHIQNIRVHDIIMLSLFLSQTDDRIRDITQCIAALDPAEDFEESSISLPAPFPIPVVTGKPLDTRSTPPLSMAISDSSNTTLDSTLVQETPMTIDSPDMVELALHDTSTATLVVGDSDDAYYDKLDPIPDALFSDNPEVPSISVFSTPRGKIDHTSSPYYREVISILKNTFKLSTFRTNQLECIIATLDAKDVFYLAPTGGGKSLCFQLPALCVTGKTQGTTFVISPLISLINDQVAALRKKGVPAFPLTSAAEENDVRQAMRMMRSNAEQKPKLVYTTPERLQKSDSLRDVVNQLYDEKQLARFVIDEAHVIGSWGRDFRASYAELNILRKNWPNVPIMALTGSANKDTIEDIKRNLTMRNPVCLAQSFNRPNLHYSVRKKPSGKKELVQNIAAFIKTNHPGDTGIIYTLSRAESEEMAMRLRDDWGIEARHYHAGINNEERKINQDDWMAGRCKVIVATIAFGMGIDKPDVRFVIHASLSKDMDGYYQETGRAGRDGKSSDCILYYKYTDAVKIEKMLQNPNDASRDRPSDSEIERQIAKLKGVVDYCDNESDCRRVLILGHFDEKFNPEDCHNQCDNCHRPGTLIRHDFTTEARQVIQLLQEMKVVNTRGVTRGQLKDTWKGMNNKTVSQYKGLSLYASGKAMTHATIDRVLTHLANEKVISTYRVPYGNGYSNNYIEPGKGAQDYLDGDKRLVLSWKEMEDDTKASAKKAPAPASRKKGKEPDFQPASRFRNLYEDIEDADDMSESDVFKDAIDNDISEPATFRMPQASTSRAPAGNSTALRSGPISAYGEDERMEPVTSRISQAFTAQAAVGSTGQIPSRNKEPVAEYEDEITARLRRLRETRRQASERLRMREDTILQDDTLEMLALTPPEDAESFRQILKDCEPDEVDNKWHCFGQEFLAALKAQALTSTRKLFDAVQMRQSFAFNG